MKKKLQPKKRKTSIHRSHLITFFILLIIMILTLTQLKKPQNLIQKAAGNTVFASPGDDLTSKAKSLTPGDTLILHDGTYTNPLNADGLQGAQGTPITIKAEHDGKAIIDGGGSAPAISANNSSFITFEGFSAHNGSGRVVSIVGNSSNIILRRITAHDTAAGNTEVFSIKEGATNILVEDCAAWGQGRYNFLAYHANNVTFRRTWGYGGRTENFSPAPRSCYGVYGSSNNVIENAICLHDIPNESSQDYFTAIWETSDGPATDNNTYRGVIFYDNWEGFWVNASAGKNTQITNSLFLNNRQQGSFTTIKDHGDGLHWESDGGGAVSNITFVNNEIGFNQLGGSEPISNSIFVNNDTAASGSIAGTNLDFFGNKSNGISPGANDKQVDPGYNTTKYGRGAYLFVPATSPLKGMGANIIYQYENGQLTTKPLWPWPMEDRIKTEFGKSATFDTGVGLWKTLDGVYGTAPNTPPSPAPSFACLGSCPTNAPTPAPTNNTPSTTIPNPGGTSTMPSIAISMLPSTPPCNTPVTQSTNSFLGRFFHSSPHRSHRNDGNNGFFGGLLSGFLELIKQLLNIIFQLLGGGTPSNPTPTPAPTPIPNSPCPSILPSNTPSTIPSTIPSTTP